MKAFDTDVLTEILLGDPTYVARAATIPPHEQAVPIIVIEELDDLKRRTSARVAKAARGTLRELWQLHGHAPAAAMALPGTKTTIEVLTDEPWHVRRPVNDEEIVEKAAAIRDLLGRAVAIATGDNAMLYRASAAGIRGLLMPPSAGSP